ncbi:MAG TPA: DoxX family protein [Thermomicrobiales bacterium]|nr:DoxX family protein [Thermomicrobiales bacterium]
MGFLDRDKGLRHNKTYDVAVLALRLTTGGLLAGHGAQKLFGSFNGPGPEGTTGMMESLGIHPGQKWAMLAGMSEFGGGMLTALGLLFPIGPISTMGAMAVATRTVHKDKPIWVTAGGAELPVTNMAVAVALTLLGPGKYSMDRILGIQVPKSFALLTTGAVAAGVIAVESMYQGGPGPEEDTGEVDPATV